MKGIITFIILIVLIATTTGHAQTTQINGHIYYSTDSMPVEFATVSLMLNDSVTVKTSLTDENGFFSFDTRDLPGMYLAISSTGCKRKKISLPSADRIFLDNSNELTEIVVRGNKNYTKTSQRGITVSMSGNPVSKLVSVTEILKHLPMIDASNGDLSVLGYGTPVLYIDNRRLYSSEELEILQPELISNIEIITNPPSKYGADVTSVIIFHTKRSNEGFHISAKGNVTASEMWSENGNVTLNYHNESGLTLFGDFSYSFSGFRQTRHYLENFYSPEYPALLYHTDTYAEAKKQSQSLIVDGGLNYDFGKNSVGFKYSFDRTPQSHYTGNALSMTNIKGYNDEISSQSNLINNASQHHVNAYGDFILPHTFGLRFDMDNIVSMRKSGSNVSNNIYNSNEFDATLWSGRAGLTKKSDNTELEIGIDLSHTESNQKYIRLSSDNLDFLKPETDNVKQTLYAGYCGFDWNPDNRWNIYGGLRMETTITDFRQNDVKRSDLSKRYDNWLPNFGVSLNVNIKISLYYRASVSRPNYRSLDNTYLYVTPTLWETGNPELLPTLRHRIGLNLSYKKFMIQNTFTIAKRSIATIYQYNMAENLNLIRPVNLPDFNSVQLVAVQRLDFAFWHPTLQGVLYMQNLEYGSPSRAYHKPLYTLSIDNRFDLPDGIYAYLNFFRLGTGNQDVLYSNGSWQASLTLNKSWKKWTFTITANDLFNTWRQRFNTSTNTVSYFSSIKGASRSLSVSIRYALNSVKGKYKGKTSRQDEVDRL